MKKSILYFSAITFVVFIFPIVTKAEVTSYTLPTSNINSGCTEPSTGLYSDENPPTSTNDVYQCDSDSSPNVEDNEQFSGFNFGLTSGVVIQGITVHLNNVSLNSTRTGTQALKVRLSWDGGTSWTASAQNSSDTCTTGDISIITLTGREYYCTDSSSTASTSDPGTAGLWGHVWTTSDLSSTNFVVQVTADNSNSSARIQRFDVAEVQIYYAPTFTQQHYRWYTNTASENVTDPWFTSSDIAEDTPITLADMHDQPVEPFTMLRLRLNLSVGTINLSSSDQQFKLQFKKGTDGSCTTGTWTDVADSSTEGVDWRYPSTEITDGTTLSSSKLTGTDILESFNRSSSPGTNPNSANIGQYIEYDFQLENYASIPNSTYSFRMVYTANDIVLNSYSNCPSLVTAPGPPNFLRHGEFFTEDGGRPGMFWAR